MNSRAIQEKSVVYVMLIVGLAISLIQFFYNRSLWLDESYLALNIVDRSYAGLLQPLDNIQVAPILFLQIEKLCSDLIPNSELGLRLFPLLSFILSLFLLRKLLGSVHRSVFTLIFSLCLFVFNPTVIYYSSELKQYMSDLLVLMYMYYFLLKDYRDETQKYYILGAAGAVGIFLSNVAPIILFTVGLYLFFDSYYQKKKAHIRHVILVSFIWGCLFLLYYVLFIHNHPSRDAQVRECRYYHYFMPVNPFKLDFFEFIVHKVQMIVNGLFRFGKVGGFALLILIIAGMISLIRKKRYGMMILTVMPLVLHLILSGLELYPFDLRMILYTIPCIILVCSFGFDYLINLPFISTTCSKYSFMIICVPLAMLALLYKNGFPLTNKEVKESIAFMREHMSPTDRIFVNYFATYPFQYYKQTGFLELNGPPVLYGKSNDITWKNNQWVSDTVKYAEEIRAADAVSGRTWFLFSSVADEDLKQQQLLNYFKSKGENALMEFHTKGSDAYLFEQGK